jgi:hypothetical protein
VKWSVAAASSRNANACAEMSPRSVASSSALQSRIRFSVCQSCKHFDVPFRNKKKRFDGARNKKKDRGRGIGSLTTATGWLFRVVRRRRGIGRRGRVHGLWRRHVGRRALLGGARRVGLLILLSEARKAAHLAVPSALPRGWNPIRAGNPGGDDDDTIGPRTQSTRTGPAAGFVHSAPTMPRPLSTDTPRRLHRMPWFGRPGSPSLRKKRTGQSALRTRFTGGSGLLRRSNGRCRRRGDGDWQNGNADRVDEQGRKALEIQGSKGLPGEGRSGDETDREGRRVEGEAKFGGRIARRR